MSNDYQPRTSCLSNVLCSKMPTLWASFSMGFLRSPGLSELHFLNLHKCIYLINESEKKITIILSVGILEHSPLLNVLIGFRDPSVGHQSSWQCSLKILSKSISITNNKLHFKNAFHKLL